MDRTVNVQLFGLGQILFVLIVSGKLLDGVDFGTELLIAWAEILGLYVVCQAFFQLARARVHEGAKRRNLAFLL